MRNLLALVLFWTIAGVAVFPARAQSSEETAGLQYQDGIGEPVAFELVVGGETKSITFVENPDGDAIYQGDIVIGVGSELAQASKGNVSLQSLGPIELFGLVIKDKSKLWPLGRLRFRVDSNLPDQSRVRDAIAHWEQNTSIEFVELAQADGDFVLFTTGSGCSSAVGRKGGMQLVRLAEGCHFKQTVHEIGHALGLHHEQARSDRAQYVQILTDNIKAGKAFNFEPDPFRYEDTGAYCYDSIMHYGPYAFSKQYGTLPTIVALDGSALGQATSLAQCDIETISELYKEEIARRN